MKITIKNFKGMAPRIDAKLLPENFAQTATNCDLREGKITAFADLNTNATFTAPGALRSLYKYSTSVYLYWTESDINVVRLQLADSDDRLMYTGDGYPKQTDTNLMAASGIPSVTSATITGATKANPVVITAVGHPFSNADSVGIIDVAGMTELNEKSYTVANKAADTFELSGINGTGYTTYTSGGTASKTPSGCRRVGITGPTAAPTITEVGSGNGITKYTISHVYTYVVKWSDGTEEESAPSPASPAIDLEGDKHVYLTNLLIPTLPATANSITHVRIYRLAAGETGEAYKIIKSRTTGATETTDFYYDIPIADIPTITERVYDTNGTATDLWDNSENEAIETTDWALPPSDLAGLIQCREGVLAAISGRDIMFCEPFVHYAWPTAYKVPVDYDPVAIAYYNEMTFVGTAAFPYVIWGTDPGSFESKILPYPQKCLSARGMISTPIGVIYPCPDGLFWINEDGGKVATKESITKEQWESLPPSGKSWADSMGFLYDDKLYYVFSGSDKGIIFSYREELWYKTFDITPNVYHGVVDPADDDLILLTNDGGANYLASEWERHASNKLTYTWKSKTFSSNRPLSMSIARVKGSQAGGSAITLKVYGDGTQLVAIGGGNFSKSVTDELPFRLPSKLLYEDISVDVSGAVDIESIEIATSPDEL